MLHALPARAVGRRTRTPTQRRPPCVGGRVERGSGEESRGESGARMFEVRVSDWPADWPTGVGSRPTDPGRGAVSATRGEHRPITWATLCPTTLGA